MSDSEDFDFTTPVRYSINNRLQRFNLNSLSKDELVSIFANNFNLLCTDNTRNQLTPRILFQMNNNFSQNSISSTMSDKPKITLQDVVKNTSNNLKIVLPDDITELIPTIDSWILELDFFDIDDQSKVFLLRSALKSSKFLDLFRDSLTITTYDDLYKHIKAKAQQNEVKLIFSPTKSKPIEAFEAIDAIFSNLNLENKIKYLNKHLDHSTINNLILTCDSSKSVKDHLKKLKFIEEDSSNNDSINFKLNKINQVLSQQAEIISQLINQKSESNYIDNKTIENRLDQLEKTVNNLKNKNINKNK